MPEEVGGPEGVEGAEGEETGGDFGFACGEDAEEHGVNEVEGSKKGNDQGEPGVHSNKL